MLPSAPEWSLILQRRGQPGERIALNADAPLTLGRDPGNQLVLPDSSISRQHARIELGPHGPRLCDLESRHGVRVNGAPRKQCLLQDGDKIELGPFELRLVAERPFNLPTFDRNSWLKLTPVVDQTQEYRVRLPEPAAERQLAILYHICFWLADGLDESLFTLRALPLLREGLQAEEIQYYGADGRLCRHVGPDRKKAAVKFAPYLAEKMQILPEVTRLPAKAVARLQERTGHYNYLVAPLRQDPDEKSPVPFVLLIKPVAWEDFSGQDAVLLQAVTSLWARGAARAHEIAKLHRENVQLRALAPGTAGLLGTSGSIQRLREQAKRLAATQATVLLVGETGSGKEIVAHLIHALSPRQHGPFIKVNCASIPDGLIESELFGHVRGAFTDAKADREGKFQLAHGGSMFLDEIGEMPVGVQAKLLRALETGEVERVGGKGPTKVNVRVIAATHRDLAAMIKAGRFREDLYYRLNVLGLRIPPLRDHLEDIPVLASHFLDTFCRENGLAGMTLTADGLHALKSHPWPGNGRELRNIIQRCAALSSSTAIDADAVQQAFAGS